jgi:hypothetical protein
MATRSENARARAEKTGKVKPSKARKLAARRREAHEPIARVRSTRKAADRSNPDSNLGRQKKISAAHTPERVAEKGFH